MIFKKTPIILLVGGKGSRYIDDENNPKQLAQIEKKPILIHMFNAYYKYGFNHFILPLGHKKKLFKLFFKNKKNKKKYKINLLNKKFTNLKKNSINIFLFDTKNNIKKLDRIKKSLKFLKNYKNIGVNYGDAICDININSIYNKFMRNQYNGIMSLAKMKSPFGHVVINKSLVTKFAEKPMLPYPTNIGYYFFKSLALTGYKTKNAELETEFLKEQIKKKKLGYYFHKGFFHTVNHKQDLISLNKEKIKL